MFDEMKSSLFTYAVEKVMAALNDFYMGVDYRSQGR